MKLYTALLIFILFTLTKSSLLDMSRTLWMKLLGGGLKRVGRLDPLRVPVIKVDQSEGNTTYRMILTNVEIVGLNNSYLESVHIARGEFKSNVSELEAGYVSYSGLRDLDMIRYRYHTLMDKSKPATGAAKRNSDYHSKSSSSGNVTRHQQNQTVLASESSGQHDARFAKIQNERTEDESNRRAQENPSRFVDRYENRSKENRKKNEDQNRRIDETVDLGRSHRDYQSFVNQTNPYSRYSTSSKPTESKVYNNSTNSSDVHVIYGQSVRNSGVNDTKIGVDVIDCPTKCQSQSSQGKKDSRQSSKEANKIRTGNVEDAQASASQNFETKAIHPSAGSFSKEFAKDQSQYRDGTVGFRAGSDFNRTKTRNSTRLEDQPGYIDIIYADEKNNGSIKHFGNPSLGSKHYASVYRLKDSIKDIHEGIIKQFMVYNFTSGEPLTKRNDALVAAMKERSLKDLIRYAKNYQEQQGYFEEGMQLIYHYGMDTVDPKYQGNSQFSRRTKRAQLDDDVENDVMHVILRIRVPLLRVKSQYLLTGKVGNEVLRGNGQLVGNFTDLIGDFTIELKKVDNDLMIIRATRAKLAAKDRAIVLQGMDKNGPVKFVLSHGLMAAEAVAAMLADDLAAKALSEKTADAMVYRMYKHLPVN